ncbi:MAG: methyltransferase domain-containing protein [Magnetococcales bacterium]|nr:methyltransferase domain-containing protein [Magnetococcales bacterium]
MNTTRTTISEEYRAMQAELHARGNYGVTAMQYGATVLKLLELCGASTLLDYGCGSKRSLLMGMNVPPHVHYEGYDPAVPAYANRPQPAQLVVCIDVLEHIEHEYLESVLDDLAELCNPFGFFTIHTGPAVKFLRDGRNAHLIQQGQGFWFARLEKRFTILSSNPVPSGFAVLVRSLSAPE